MYAFMSEIGCHVGGMSVTNTPHLADQRHCHCSWLVMLAGHPKRHQSTRPKHTKFTLQGCQNKQGVYGENLLERFRRICQENSPNVGLEHCQTAAGDAIHNIDCSVLARIISQSGAITLLGRLIFTSVAN